MQSRNSSSVAYASLFQWHFYILCCKFDLGNLPHQASRETHRYWRGKTWKSKPCHNFHEGRSTPDHWYESGTVSVSTLCVFSSMRQPVYQLNLSKKAQPGQQCRLMWSAAVTWFTPISPWHLYLDPSAISEFWGKNWVQQTALGQHCPNNIS